jgi:hypothetical protein
MNLPTPQNTISWNGVISAVLAIVAAGAAYGLLRGDVTSVRGEHAHINDRIAETRSILSETRGRVTALEIGAGRSDQRLQNIEAGIARIEQMLRNDR